MYPRVTAILVARNGGEHLSRTLDALRAQTRQPDVVIAVDLGSADDTAALLAAYGPQQVITSSEELSFGEAVAAAVRVTAPPSSDDEMLWLLAQDSAPEPGALAALVGALETAPSVAVAGPKVMQWEALDYFHEFGHSITPYGTAVSLVEDELDQGQHDVASDVLAVGPAGLLVRHSVWERLGGFDPGLPVADDALDFSVRVRLAGYRVALVPAARIASAGDGVAGPSGSERGSARRRRARQERSAQLHRRLVYSPTIALAIHWLSLVPLAIIRSLGLLLRKKPGNITGEFAAAFHAAFADLRVSAARRNLKSTRKLGWSSISPLRMPHAEVRRRRALLRELAVVQADRQRRELHFFARGGAWTVLGATVLGIILFFPLLGAVAAQGGGLLPLPATPAELWQSIGFGWRDVGLGFVGAADPFAAVLAVLGSITFWSPSYALVLLYFAALPLAALGAWLAAARITERGGLRLLAAVLWALAPTLLSALATGRPSAILAHLLLPWLFFAGFAAVRSWAASAATALLFAAVIACAPSLAPALIVLWFVCVLVSGRAIARFIAIPLPAIALFAPLVIQQGIFRGNWLGLLADPGTAIAGPTPTSWQLAQGFPGEMHGGWDALVAALGIPGVTSSIVIPVLLAPLAVLALLSLFLRGTPRAIGALLVALVGFATAVAASLVAVTVVGDSATTVWAGAGLSLYWIGLVGAAVLALSALGRFAIVPALVMTITLGVVAAPLATSMIFGNSSVTAGIGRTLPAFVTAEAANDSRQGTLELIPLENGGMSAVIVRGAGTTLNAQSTLANTQTIVTESNERLAVLAGNLASRSGLDVSAGLSEFGIDFVLLRPAAGEADAEAEDAASASAASTRTRAATALDANPILSPVGDTDYGLLWHFTGDTGESTYAQIPRDAGGALGPLVLVVQGVAVGLMLLLSIPTGRGREIERWPSWRSRGKGDDEDTAGTGAAGPDETGPDETGPDETGPDAEPPDADAAAANGDTMVGAEHQSDDVGAAEGTVIEESDGRGGIRPQAGADDRPAVGESAAGESRSGEQEDHDGK